MNFNLELDKAIKEIKKTKAKLVLIQLPDGLKPQATIISDLLESKTKAKILIWSDSCYGACDVPNVKVDLIIQFGHNELQPKI